MTRRICLIGLDEPEHRELAGRFGVPVVAHESVPKIVVSDGQLFVESRSGAHMLAVSHVVFHGIFEHDLDLIAALALWGGPCLPNAAAMMDCRLKLPCLVRALRHSRFAAPRRGYASPGATFFAEREHVAKWGNWHCGENKERFIGLRESEKACIVEPFLTGESVRVVVLGDQAWQIRLSGPEWLKSIHDPHAEFMPLDAELLADTRAVAGAIGLELAANDYLVDEAGDKHLLELNHIPNVTRFPEIRTAYLDYVERWACES